MFGRKRHTEDEEMEAMTRSYLRERLGISSPAPAQQSEMDAWAAEQQKGWTWKPHTRPTFPEIEGLND